MIHPNIRFIRAVGTMIGAVVGVGVFGLPYAFAQTGFGIGALMLLFLGVIMLVLQLMYAEIIIKTPGKDRFVGYMDRYIGWKTGKFALVALSVSLWGAMLAYIIVGGQFLHLLLSPQLGGEVALYSIGFSLFVSFLMYRGLGFVARLEVVVVSILLFLFLFMSLAALPHLSLEHVMTYSWSGVPIVYGVALFALGGIGVIPELRDILGRRQVKQLPKVLMVALVLIVLLYLVFSFSVIGATGPATTQMAFDGLVPLLGASFGVIGALLALLTVTSIYLVLGVQLQNTLRYDMRVPRIPAWLITASVPLVLFVLGVREFIEVVGFVGSVFSGILGILIVIAYKRAARAHVSRVPALVSWFIVILFSIGILLEFF